MSIELGKRIKEARLKIRISQINLAKHLGISPRSIQNYESGVTDPSSKIIIKIADICKVADRWLLTGDEKEGIFLENKNVVKEETQTYNNKDEMIEFLFTEIKKRDAIIKDLEAEKELWRGVTLLNLANWIRLFQK